MTHARIYQKPKNAMQSGRAGTDLWLLEFEPTAAQAPDPLMGWAGSADTRRQLSLSFGSAAEAEAYAAKKGIIARVEAAPKKVLKLQTYADNFR
jgi:ETC complex I subunit conserved region